MDTSKEKEMSSLNSNTFAVTKYGMVASLLAILFGLGLGLAFGAIEGRLKQGLRSSGDSVLATVYKGDKAKLAKTLNKSWSYYKRAHLHAGAMGTTALVICILLSLLGLDRRLAMGLSLCVGLGALGYSVFWLLAGMRAPLLGSTGLAKESLEWLAIPSAGLYGLGLIIATGCFVQRAFLAKTPD